MSQLPQEEKINRIRRIILDSREGVEEQHPELRAEINIPPLQYKLVDLIDREIAIETGVLLEERIELLERQQQLEIALEKALAIAEQFKEYYETTANKNLTKSFYEDFQFIKNKLKK